MCTWKSEMSDVFMFQQSFTPKSSDDPINYITWRKNFFLTVLVFFYYRIQSNEMDPSDDISIVGYGWIKC